MRLVIDSNRLLAGLIKDSTSRKIILDEHFKFYSPDYLLTEINKYKSYLVNYQALKDLALLPGLEVYVFGGP